MTSPDYNYHHQPSYSVLRLQLPENMNYHKDLIIRSNQSTNLQDLIVRSNQSTNLQWYIIRSNQSSNLNWYVLKQNT